MKGPYKAFSFSFEKIYEIPQLVFYAIGYALENHNR